ncbi:MAG TPA: ADP-ribosylglycohydrolase family protein [Ktedonobacterales bacterium]
MDSSPEARLARARISLDGLSVGDAFGDRFFVHPGHVEMLIESQALPATPWEYSDDTQMALSIVAILRNHDAIDQDRLAQSFGRHYDLSRGYGPAMHGLLRAIRSQQHWSKAARALFGGQGSYGNGAAMRVAPVGAYFADDLDATVTHAAASAAVTHAHTEAAAGAIAVAVAAALASQARETGATPSPPDFFEGVLARVPESEVRSGIRRARDLDADASVAHAVTVLGNGSLVSAQDTVPFTLWCAAHHLENYVEALWTTLRGLGDRDTTCAIVGGIVACRTGSAGIPAEWLAAREPLPEWAE